MASEDVIELGSSDDETEPATTKMKPVPNAMVHIPNKIHNVTIKPMKSNSNKPIPKILTGTNVTVTKITKSNVVTNPYANKTKPNGKVTKKVTPLKSPLRLPKIVHPKQSVNPINIMKKINSQVVVNKISPPAGVLKHPVRIHPIKVHSPRSLNSLPPSITITKTSGGAMKRTGAINVTNSIHKKQKVNRVSKPTTGEVLTVDLDDDEVSSASTASPQWYVRPEEQMEAEEVNNKEPEKPLYVEITIEDSPVKPPPNKRMGEVGTELAVTIDDSPVKIVTEKNEGSGSDVENKKSTKDKQSKKKLKYLQDNQPAGNAIEIEISPCVAVEFDRNVNYKNNGSDNVIIEIEESPLKIDDQGTSTSTPKKNHMKARLETAVPMLELQEDDELDEFHPVYRNFIKLCFQLENSDDMKKIVEKKIKTYYRQVPKEFTESEEFIDMVSSKIVAMKAGPEKMYLYIKDIVDELNLQRKLVKSQVSTNVVDKASESDRFLYGEDSEYDSRRQRQIRKLEKTLKKLHRAIQKLEEQEVDFDDDEDSVYLLTESDEDSTSNKDSDKKLEKDPKALLQRYKERMVRVHAKFCQLTNTKMPSEPRVQIDARPGQPQGPAKRLEKWINKKVPIGTPLPFPDFHDVLRCVREANEEDKLKWNEVDIMDEARDLFTRCGKKLQRRRQENEWRLAASRITTDVDPAERSDELKRKLEENKKTATKKETEVFNKYADRQNQLKLEAEEIGEKEAEESPVESDEDEAVDESPLQNTEKRKERLKRLLQEKYKKSSDEKRPKSTNNSDQEDTNKNVESEKCSIEKSVNNTVATNQSKNELASAEQEDNNEANKENQLTITDEANKEVEPCEKDKVDESESAGMNIDKEETKKDDNETIHSLSDDSKKLESDVDELHLLQKLHSENEIYSTSELSGYETLIAISDTLGSSEDSKKKSSAVISIENSSYSETETNDATEVTVIENVQQEEEMDHSEDKFRADHYLLIVKTNNDEYNESIEDILLASSDEEAEAETGGMKPAKEDETVILKEDTLSIGDTVVEEGDVCTEKNNVQKPEDTNSVESVTLVSVTENLNEEETEITKAVSTEIQETVSSIDSPNLNLDINNKEAEIGGKISDSQEVSDKIDEDLIEKTAACINANVKAAVESTDQVNSAMDIEKLTEVMNEPSVAMDLDATEDKNDKVSNDVEGTIHD